MTVNVGEGTHCAYKLRCVSQRKLAGRVIYSLFKLVQRTQPITSFTRRFMIFFSNIRPFPHIMNFYSAASEVKPAEPGFFQVKLKFLAPQQLLRIFIIPPHL